MVGAQCDTERYFQMYSQLASRRHTVNGFYLAECNKLFSCAFFPQETKDMRLPLCCAFDSPLRSSNSQNRAWELNIWGMNR